MNRFRDTVNLCWLGRQDRHHKIRRGACQRLALRQSDSDYLREFNHRTRQCRCRRDPERQEKFESHAVKTLQGM